MTETSTQPTGNGRRQVIVIMAIAFLSLGGSYLLFYLASTQGGWGTTNNGEFVQPPVQVGSLQWQADADGRYWWLWVVDQQGCGSSCAQAVKDMRALHILLSAEAGRVRRAVTSLDGPVGELAEEYPKLERVPVVVPAALSQQIKPSVFIVDPNGNLVFRYPLDGNPKNVLQDLKKLLKVSQIG